jgi:hypothetical protein
VEEDGAGAAASLSLSDEGEEEEAPGRLEQKEENRGTEGGVCCRFLEKSGGAGSRVCQRSRFFFSVGKRCRVMCVLPFIFDL